MVRLVSSGFRIQGPGVLGLKGCELWASGFTCDFPKIRVPNFGGPYNKDPTVKGTIFGSPIVGNPKGGSPGVKLCNDGIFKGRGLGERVLRLMT